MLNIESLIKVKRVMCLKTFLRDYPSSWKVIPGKILSPVGGRFLLYCNFDTTFLKISLPACYKECLDAWSELNRKTPSSSHKMSIYRDDMIKVGFFKIGDVVRQITLLVLTCTAPHCYLLNKISFQCALSIPFPLNGAPLLNLSPTRR